MNQPVALLSGPFESGDCFNLVVARSRLGIALGRKTRGYGEGDLVLPGGKTQYYLGPNGIYEKLPAQDASRELREETGLDIPTEALMHVGGLMIATEDDNKNVTIFTGSTLQSDLRSSPELAGVAWYPTDDLPYAEMPQDYQYWLPHVLGGYGVMVFMETDEDVIYGGDVYRVSPEPRVCGDHFKIPSAADINVGL